MTDSCTTPPCQHHATPRTAADGLRVCQPHVDRFLNHCTAIPDLWAPFLDHDALLPTKGTGGRGAPGIALSVPINLTVFAMNDSRTSWAEPGDLLNPRRALGEIAARILLDATGVQHSIGRFSVAESCEILGRSKLTRWALAQDWAGLMCWTVALVHQQLVGMSQEHRPRSVGSCPECPGRLWPIPTGARCGSCGHSISGFDLYLSALGLGMTA